MIPALKHNINPGVTNLNQCCFCSHHNVFMVGLVFLHQSSSDKSQPVLLLFSSYLYSWVGFFFTNYHVISTFTMSKFADAKVAYSCVFASINFADFFIILKVSIHYSHMRKKVCSWETSSKFKHCNTCFLAPEGGKLLRNLSNIPFTTSSFNYFNRLFLQTFVKP